MVTATVLLISFLVLPSFSSTLPDPASEESKQNSQINNFNFNIKLTNGPTNRGQSRSDSSYAGATDGQPGEEKTYPETVVNVTGDLGENGDDYDDEESVNLIDGEETIDGESVIRTQSRDSSYVPIPIGEERYPEEPGVIIKYKPDWALKSDDVQEQAIQRVYRTIWRYKYDIRDFLCPICLGLMLAQSDRPLDEVAIRRAFKDEFGRNIGGVSMFIKTIVSISPI